MTKIELEIQSRIMAFQQKQNDMICNLLKEISVICENEKIQLAQDLAIPNTNSEKWVTAAELAKHFGISKSSIYDRAKKGEIPEGVKFGVRETRWKISEVEKFLTQPKYQSSNFNVILNVSKKSTRGRKSRIQKLKELQHV